MSSGQALSRHPELTDTSSSSGTLEQLLAVRGVQEGEGEMLQLCLAPLMSQGQTSGCCSRQGWAR